MNPKIKALAWEELRVGGSIAGVLLAASLAGQLANRLAWGEFALQHDGTAILFVLGFPVALALLLVLNADYSGALTGGFSRRILKLPVPVSVAVAIAFTARPLILLSTTSVVVIASRTLFEGAPGFEAILVVTMVYLVFQLFDWARALFSGLVSALVLLGAISLLLRTTLDARPFINLFSLPEWYAMAPSEILFAGILVLVLVYTASVPIVHATRIGRTWGLPEIWEWPNQLRFRAAARLKPFSEPLAAQVWFDLRRAGWVMPAFAVLASIVSAVVLFFQVTGEEEAGVARIVVAYAPYFGAILGASSQSLASNIAGFRKSAGTPGYRYVQPLSSADFATARIIANAISFVPTILFAVAVQFVLTSTPALVRFLAHAHELGLASVREIAWMFLSRAALATIVAWGLLAIGSRLMGTVFFLGIAVVALSGGINYRMLGFVSDHNLIPLWVLFIATTLIAYGAAWRDSLVPGRVVAFWGIGWTLATGLIFSAVRTSLDAGDPSPVGYAIGVMSCAGLTALIPLPYVALMLDFRKRRNGRELAQEASHGRFSMRSIWGTRDRRLMTAGLSIMALAAVWLSWPTPPAYVETWRSAGLPATLSELDDWYTAVPDEQNAALRYLKIAEERRLREEAFLDKVQKKIVEHGRPRIVRIDTRYSWVLTMIHGNADVQLDQQIPAVVWQSTEMYWREVVLESATAMKGIGFEEAFRSRYPVKLADGPHMNVDHCSTLRMLARDGYLDAVCHAVQDESENAADSIVAIVSLTNSMSGEPLLLASLVRISMMGIAAGGFNEVLNRTVLDEHDLSRVQWAFENTFPPVSEGLTLDRAMIGEPIVLLSLSGVPIYEQTGAALLPLERLVANPTSMSVLVPAAYEKTRSIARLPWAQFQFERDELNRTLEDFDLYAPMAGWFLRTIPDIYVAERRIRTYFSIAAAAAAVERFRLAHGVLPEALDELVPQFLREVPEDYFSAAGGPIKYQTRDDSGFILYSVGRDSDDDFGNEKENPNKDGDYIFKVAPLSFRLGPQIEEATVEQTGSKQPSPGKRPRTPIR